MYNRCKIMNSALLIYEKFVATLTEQQIKMFEEVLDKLFIMNEKLSKADFKEGFKLGLVVATEAIKN